MIRGARTGKVYVDESNKGGAIETVHDVGYVASFVLMASCFSDWVNAIWILIALYALYKAIVNFVVPMMSGSGSGGAQGDMDGGEEQLTKTQLKKRRREEKFANRH
eukprot:UC1_evm1s2011